MNKQYYYGDCIPESIKEYNRLKKKGYSPIIVEGWVEIDNPELLADEDFLRIFYPEMYLDLLDDINYNDYSRVSPHTWLELGGIIIDITRNQFDYCGGIIEYFENCRYWFKSKKPIPITDDIMCGRINPDKVLVE